MSLTIKQREMARHALGLDYHQMPKVSFRNRYVCPEDNEHWQDMVSKGYAIFAPAAKVPFGGNAIFYLTRKGAELALDKGDSLDPEDFPPISAAKQTEGY